MCFTEMAISCGSISLLDDNLGLLRLVLYVFSGCMVACILYAKLQERTKSRITLLGLQLQSVCLVVSNLSLTTETGVESPGLKCTVSYRYPFTKHLLNRRIYLQGWIQDFLKGVGVQSPRKGRSVGIFQNDKQNNSGG